MTGTPARVWVNGRLLPGDEPALSAFDRGFTLGDGLFETMLASHGHVRSLEDHLARLARGASVLELPLPSRSNLRRAVAQTLASSDDEQSVVRLTVSRGPSSGQGVLLPPDPSPTVVVRAAPLIRPPLERYRRGYHVIVSSIRRNEGSPLSRIKSSNYLDAVLARREAQHRGVDEGILLNTRGEPVCATVANLFMIAGGVLWTPPEESGVLPGVTRARVLEEARRLGIAVRTDPFTLDTVHQADEVFLTNTVLGVMPVTGIQGRPVGEGRPGDLTHRLSEAYETSAASQSTDAQRSRYQ